MRITTLLLLALLTCMSCGKDDDPEPEPEPKTGNCMTAVINGEEFIAETTTGIFFITEIDYGNAGIVESKNLTIRGTIPSFTSNIRTIDLLFSCAEFETNLDVENSDEDCGIGMSYNSTNLTDPNGVIVVPAQQGVIIVESLTEDRIRGTFTFSGIDQNSTEYTITEGFFDTTISQ